MVNSKFLYTSECKLIYKFIGIWKTLSSLRGGSEDSKQSETSMSESCPFAHPQSLLNFSEYDADTESSKSFVFLSSDFCFPEIV